MILDATEKGRNKTPLFQRMQYIGIVILIGTNCILLLRYQLDASGAFITTCPNEPCTPPITAFMNNFWKYLLGTNLVGGVVFVFLHKKAS
ncbi:hypothetical protein [Aureispira sp. CCB-E]|uniref:hypothetical protein n=1 Tax=Aureispira sp. CCB-E TaxID=3051121 RepID=UPI002868B0C8|nr:hypothetical protein [Aureispira sp. CCB-E]WMX12876.1 hypothetical protein QP953_18735 [Aureispira sp. CCB-E]